MSREWAEEGDPPAEVRRAWAALAREDARAGPPLLRLRVGQMFFTHHPWRDLILQAYFFRASSNGARKGRSNQRSPWVGCDLGGVSSGSVFYMILRLVALSRGVTPGLLSGLREENCHIAFGLCAIRLMRV